jgi:hypothetical protein
MRRLWRQQFLLARLAWRKKMPAKKLFARLSVVALALTIMTAMFAGTAYAAAATNTTKGSVGAGAASDAPVYAWAGSNFSVDLSIDTDATSNVKQYTLIFDGPGVCSLSDADTVFVTGPGECVVAGRVNSGNGYTASTDELEISITKGTQATFTADASTGAVYGKTVNLSASGGTTSGTIAYTKVSGDCSVNNAVATATVTALSVPALNCVVRATMAGNTYYESVFDDVTITVSKAPRRKHFALASPSSVTFADPNPTSTLSLQNYVGTGAVTYTKVSGDCTVAGTTATITGGTTTCKVLASVAADNNYLASTNHVKIRVSKTNQAAFSVAASDTTVTYGEPAVTLTPSGGSGTGVITYSVTGGCTNVGATVTITSGTTDCVATATKPADNDYFETSDDVTITVSKATQAALQVLTDAADGTTATYTSPNGTVTLTNDGGGSGTGGYSYSRVSGDCTVSGSSATITGGTNDCVVRVTRAADDNYLEATDDATIDVSKGTQSSLQVLTDGTDGTSAGYDTTVTLTNDGGGSGTGGLSYSRVSGDCTVTENTATITGVATDCVVRVTRAADDNYLEKTDDATIAVGKATQAPLVALTDGTDGTSAYLTTVALSSSGGSGGGAVTFAKVSGNCTVSGTTATITGSTTDCIVEATKAADVNYFVITDRVTILVGGNTQATFTALANGQSAISVTSSDSTSITLSSSGGSGGGAVTFAKVSGDCTVAGSTATITGYTNNCVVEATSAAAGGYAAATDQVTIAVSSASLPTTSASPTVRRSGRNATVTSSGTWAANGGTLSAASYQWYQCTSAKSAVAAASSVNAPADCVAIAGATTSTWRITGVNRKYLRVLVTRSNEAGSSYAWSKTFSR